MKASPPSPTLNFSKNYGFKVLEKAIRNRLDHQKRELNQKRLVIEAKKKIIQEEQMEAKMNELTQAAFREKFIERNLDHHATINYHCSCHLCQMKEDSLSKKKALTTEIEEPVRFVDPDEKDFNFLLKKLFPVRNQTNKSLKLLIPDTVVFENGEPIFIVYNSRERFLRFIKQKEKLTLTEIRKFLQERKRKLTSQIDFFDENTITIRNKVAALNNNTNNNDQDSKKVSKIGSLIMSENGSILMDGQSSANIPSELATGGISKKSKATKKIIEVSNATRDAISIRYKDDSVQILSEQDFSYFMMKRKIEAIWKEINFMQLAVDLMKNHPYLIKVEFDESKDKKQATYQKALEFVLYLKDDQQNDVEGFSDATEEDYYEDSLRNKNLFEYCQYLTYKLICYVEAFTGTKITRMFAEFALEYTSRIYLINAGRILYNNSAPADYVLHKVSIVDDPTREKIKKELNSAKAKMKMEFIQVLKEFMSKTYGTIKKKTRILEVEDKEIIKHDDLETDKAFKEMNSDAPFNFSDFLKNKVNIEEFKEWLSMRAITTNLGPNSIYTRVYNKVDSHTKYSNSKGGGGKSLANFFSNSNPITRKASFFSYDRLKAEKKKMKVLDICGNGASKKKHKINLPSYQLQNLDKRLKSALPSKSYEHSIVPASARNAKYPKQLMLDDSNMKASHNLLLQNTEVEGLLNSHKDDANHLSKKHQLSSIILGNNISYIKESLNKPTSLTHMIYVRPSTAY